MGLTTRIATRAFPAAVVLTGCPGAAQALVDEPHHPRSAQRLAEEGRMRPMILVMPRPTVAPPRDTECVDVPTGWAEIRGVGGSPGIPPAVTAP